MNEYEITEAWHYAGHNGLTNYKRGALILAHLRDWANQNSDGWMYWALPRKASAKLQAALEQMMRTHWREVEDLTDAELTKLLSPIKAFLTRQKVDHGEVFKP